MPLDANSLESQIPETSPTIKTLMQKSLFALLIGVSSLFSPQVNAQTFDELANQYRSYDAQCQNTGANCWARDEVGEKLSSMGAYLCGRRDWYATLEQATNAGCR